MPKSECHGRGASDSKVTYPGGGGNLLLTTYLLLYFLRDKLACIFSRPFYSICVCACMRACGAHLLDGGGRGLSHPPTPWLSTADLCFLASPLTSL